MEMKGKLADFLSGRTKFRFVDGGFKPSAVLVPLFNRNGDYYILFTKRTQTVRYHKGEISFPGGGYHSEDGSLVNTALRESFEEIGLPPGDVEILGELDDIPTRTSSYTVSPFVGFIRPDCHFKLSPRETAEILEIPVKALLQKDCMSQAPDAILGGMVYSSCVYSYQGNQITGVTARILNQFLDIFCQLGGQSGLETSDS
jgi:8-oxo-dGTP pyrophosphatase MutT (NUDIX family)